jgi:D-lactate dehydrogenase (cytochrome)
MYNSIGMVGTSASGTTTVRYGTMRENILEVEFVMADEQGTIVRAGTQALKNSAGYDLVSLICGSEGTLGIITKITVKLHPVPSFIAAATCVFSSIHDAAQAVATVRLRDIPVQRSELLDSVSMTAFNNLRSQQQDPSVEHMATEVAPTIFFEFTGISQQSVLEQLQLTKELCQDEYNGRQFQVRWNADERKALWEARHSLYYASLALRPGATGAIVTDVCVPLSQFAQIIAATVDDVKDVGMTFPCFGHAGDGNFHCIMPIREKEDPLYLACINMLNEKMIQRALRVGGTCTGEHGVGQGKIKHLENQFGFGAVQLMKIIKAAMDPFSLLNPGKVVLTK